MFDEVSQEGVEASDGVGVAVLLTLHVTGVEVT